MFFSVSSVHPVVKLLLFSPRRESKSKSKSKGKGKGKGKGKSFPTGVTGDTERSARALIYLYEIGGRELLRSGVRG